MTRHTDYPYIMYPVFAAELCPDTHILANFLYFGFPFQIAECLTSLVSLGRQVVVISRGCFLHGRQAGFGRSSADDHGQVVRRTSGSTQVFHLFLDELGQRFLGQKGFGLLIEESLVGRTASFGDKQELVFIALRGVQVDLRGKVRSAVFLVEHGVRYYLRVTQVAIAVGFIHPFADCLGVVESGPHVFTFLADSDGGTRVLTGGEFSLGGHDLIH